MVLLNPLISISSKLPPLRLDVSRLQKVFYSLGIAADARRYVSLVFLFLLLALLSFPFSTAASLAFLVVGALLYALPSMELSSLKQDIAAEMPLFLRNVGSLLKMGLPFEKALEVASQEGPLAEQLSFVLRHSRKVGVVRALQDFSEKLGTETTKRAVAQLIAVYGFGGGEELKRLGNELLNAQRHRLKEYGAKSSMLALFFMMFAVIAPTFYVVAAAVSQSFSSGSVSLNEAFFVLDIISPAISFAIVVVSIMFFPSVVFTKKELSLRTVPLAILLSALFFLPVEQELRLAAFFLLFFFALYRFFGTFLKQRSLQELETKLADALLMVSAMPKGAHLKDVFQAICKEGMGLLSKEFCVSLKQLKRGMSIDAVLKDMRERVPSKVFSRTLDVLSYAFKSGRNITEKVAELAEDLLMFTELKREQLSLLSIQKYSLLIGMLLVPFILSATLGIVSSLEVLDPGTVSGLRWNIIPAYLILTSSITSVFITTLEGSRSAELLYFSLLSLLNIVIFFNFSLNIA